MMWMMVVLCRCALREILGGNKNYVFILCHKKVLKYVNEVMYDQF